MEINNLDGNFLLHFPISCVKISQQYFLGTHIFDFVGKAIAKILIWNQYSHCVAYHLSPDALRQFNK
jgi:hypothetical protein